MALTATVVEKYSIGNHFECIVDVTFDSSYLTGGEALTVAMAGLRNRITHVCDAVARNATTGAVLVRCKPDSVSTQKLLQCFQDDDPTGDGPFVEVASATDLSAYTVRLVVKGK